MAADERMSAVAQVRTHPSARIDGGFDLIAGCFRMANRNQDSAVGNFSNEVRGVFVFGRHGEQLDAALGCVLQTLKLVPIGLADMLFRMRAARSVVGANEWPLQMNTGDS